MSPFVVVLKAFSQRALLPLAFWALLFLVLFTPFQIQRWRQASKPNDASQHTLNVAATALARWQDNGLVAYSRTSAGVTVDLSQAASDYAAMTRADQAAVWTICRQLTWRGSPVTRCIIRDLATGRVLVDESAEPEH